MRVVCHPKCLLGGILSKAASPFSDTRDLDVGLPRSPYSSIERYCGGRVTARR